MKNNKLEKTLDFFINLSLLPIMLMGKNKTVRLFFIIPMLFLSMITLVIFGIPILLLFIFGSIEMFVNNEL